MKVYLKDIRINPRSICLEGKRLAFPSKKEVLLDVSAGTIAYLKTLPFIKLRDYQEECKGEIKEVIEEAPKEEPIEEAPKEEIHPVKEEAVEIKEEPKIEEPKTEEPKIEEPQIEEIKNDTAEVLQDSEIVSQEEVTVDYSSMSKKELRELIESKGGDPHGMAKSNMVDWLKANA